MNKNPRETELYLRTDKYIELESKYDKLFGEYIEVLHKFDKFETENTILSNKNEWYKKLLQNHNRLLDEIDVKYIEKYLRLKKIKKIE